MPLVLIAVVSAVGLFAYLESTGAIGAAASDPAETIDTTAPVADVPLINDSGEVTMIVNTDQSTWPTGDKVWQFAHAIALAEGYEVENSVPSRLHNPGDISDGRLTFGSESHDGSNVTTFPDDATGWKWLYNKLTNALTGKSTVFKPTMTFWEFAQKYAGDSTDWARNVCNHLGVNESDVIGEWYSA
jgi:hypothetical protein